MKGCKEAGCLVGIIVRMGVLLVEGLEVDVVC